MEKFFRNWKETKSLENAKAILTEISKNNKYERKEAIDVVNEIRKKYMFQLSMEIIKVSCYNLNNKYLFKNYWWSSNKLNFKELIVLADAFHHKGMNFIAIHLYEEVLKRFPQEDSSKILYKLALCYERMEDEESSLKCGEAAKLVSSLKGYRKIAKKSNELIIRVNLSK